MIESMFNLSGSAIFRVFGRSPGCRVASRRVESSVGRSVVGRFSAAHLTPGGRRQGGEEGDERRAGSDTAVKQQQHNTTQAEPSRHTDTHTPGTATGLTPMNVSRARPDEWCCWSRS